MEKYKTCVFSIFDQIFGEYKCELRKIGLYNPKYCSDCELYKARKKGEEQKMSKEDYRHD